MPTGLPTNIYGNYPILASLVLFSVPGLVLYFLFQPQGLTAGALKTIRRSAGPTVVLAVAAGLEREREARHSPPWPLETPRQHPDRA